MSVRNEVYEIAYNRMMKDRMRPEVCKLAGVHHSTFTGATQKMRTPMPSTAIKIVDALIAFGYLPKGTDPLQVLPPRRAINPEKYVMPSRVASSDDLSELWLEWIGKKYTSKLIVKGLTKSKNADTRRHAENVMAALDAA